MKKRSYYVGIVGEVIWGCGRTREEAKAGAINNIKDWNRDSSYDKIKTSRVKVVPCSRETYDTVSERGFDAEIDAFVIIGGIAELIEKSLNEKDLEELTPRELRVLIKQKQNEIKLIRSFIKNES